jgi:hypothetical protein
LAKKKTSLPPMRPPASTIAEFPAPPPPGSRTPSTRPKTRDPLDVVREAIGELDFLESAQAASSICCSALALGLGAKAVIIHAHDTGKKEIRVVAAHGPKADVLLGKAALVEDDVVASTVIVGSSSMRLMIDPDVGLPRRSPERLKAVGAQRMVIAVPAFVKKRVVAILEIVDPKESAATAVEPAAEFAARELARFLERRKKKTEA